MAKRRLTLLILGVLLFPVGSALAQKGGQPVVVESRYSFDETVKKIKDTIVGKGMMVIAEADHKMMLKMLQVDSPGSITIMFGRPQMGEMLLKAEPKAALEMPMRVAVRELAGKVVVLYYKPSYMFSHYRNPNLDSMGQMMDKTVEEIVAAGTK
jgi:uncharacterized protein (DUF302 family)